MRAASTLVSTPVGQDLSCAPIVNRCSRAQPGPIPGVDLRTRIGASRHRNWLRLVKPPEAIWPACLPPPIQRKISLYTKLASFGQNAPTPSNWLRSVNPFRANWSANLNWLRLVKPSETIWPARPPPTTQRKTSPYKTLASFRQNHPTPSNWLRSAKNLHRTTYWSRSWIASRPSSILAVLTTGSSITWASGVR